MEFYKKSKAANITKISTPKNQDILELLSGNTRLSMAFDLVSNGVNANEAFKLTTLDDFLIENSKPKAANIEKEKSRLVKAKFHSSFY
jgi:hypothetical protein